MEIWWLVDDCIVIILKNNGDHQPIYDLFKMGKACIIYPRYMDSEATLKDGRRLGLEHSVPRPSLVEIEAAIRKVYPSAQVLADPGKRYPKSAVEPHDIGYLKIDKETIKAAGGKLELLKSLQKHIIEARQEMIDTLKQPEEKKDDAKAV